MEIINIYNDNHELLGTADKDLAHKLGLWHEVFTSLIINPAKNTVFFQIKKQTHNNIHAKDLIEITVGGHYLAEEKIEDGTREIKEETGLDVSFDQLISLGIRQVATTPATNYIIREFQHIFLCPLDVGLKDFKNYDKSEVTDFIQFDIDELINLLLEKTKKIKGKTLSETFDIDLNNFVNSYLKGDKLYLRLLIVAKRFIDNENVDYIFW